MFHGNYKEKKSIVVTQKINPFSLKRIHITSKKKYKGTTTTTNRK